jgi:hypothetical protein
MRLSKRNENVCLEGLSKTSISCSDRDINLGPPDYEVDVLISRA